MSKKDHGLTFLQDQLVPKEIAADSIACRLHKLFKPCSCKPDVQDLKINCLAFPLSRGDLLSLVLAFALASPETTFGTEPGIAIPANIKDPNFNMHLFNIKFKSALCCSKLSHYTMKVYEQYCGVPCILN